MDAENQPISRADELNGHGAKFFHEGDITAARMHFLAALSLDPNHAYALMNLGATLRNLDQYEAAASVARRSVKASGGHLMHRGNLGTVLLALRKYPEAETELRAVVEQAPTLGTGWHNLGLFNYITGRRSEAETSFRRAIAEGYDNGQLRSDLSLTLLSLGKLAEGLAEYECRWATLWKAPVWEMQIPEWQGEDISGCSIVVHHEQGFGDTLMLARFARDLHERGAQVTLAVPKELVRLMAQSFPMCQVMDVHSTLLRESKFDYHSPTLSVLRHLKLDTWEIRPTPYLRAERRREIKLPGARKKIGICWASGNHGPAFRERRRMVPVTQFLPLTELDDTAVVSLQLGEPKTDLLRHGLEGLVYDPSYRIEDFADTAEIIECLDLVITVDSAVAHLAGGMGKPVIMLSPWTRCWRWWNPYSGQPWYGDMTIRFQSSDGSWDSAVADAIKLAEHMQR